MSTNGRDPHDPLYYRFPRNSGLHRSDFRSPFEVSTLSIFVVVVLLIVIVGSVAAMGVCPTKGCW
jgi:hypothetical protein